MTDKKISPLRRRLIEDMIIRNMADSTQTTYVTRVSTFQKPRRSVKLQGKGV